VHVLIFFVIVSPPMLFLNYKLLMVVRKSRRGNQTCTDVENTFSLKNVSSCLLAVACYVTLSIPVFVYVGLRMNSTYKMLNLDSSNLTAIWCMTIASMNSTFNCLIFFWKDKVLRPEGLKVFKSLKISRLMESQSEQ
jgi:hypothetical protein